MMLNYKLIMVADAMVAHSPDELRATFADTLFVFGNVMTYDEVAGLLCAS
jgi:nicotinamidase-related amidase